jgi:ribonuclease P/MRP protein subunit POP5
MKLRPLMPSLREKKRYVAFEVESVKKVDSKEAQEIIEKSFKRLVGELGLAKAGIKFMKDWKNNRGIIKVNTRSVDELKAAFALINEENIIIKSLTLSGSIEKVRNQCF